MARFFANARESKQPGAAPGLAGLGAAGVQREETHMNDTILREPKPAPITCAECHLSAGERRRGRVLRACRGGRGAASPAVRGCVVRAPLAVASIRGAVAIGQVRALEAERAGRRYAGRGERRNAGLCLTCGAPAPQRDYRALAVNLRIAEGRTDPGEVAHPLARLTTAPFCAMCLRLSGGACDRQAIPVERCEVDPA